MIFIIITILFSLTNADHINYLRKIYRDTTPLNITKESYDRTTVNCITGTVTSACSYHGVCSGNYTCVCNTGYITFPSSSINGCNYKQKSQLTAFLLQFFLGEICGAGEFYLGNNDIGAGQIVYFWGNTIFIILMICTLTNFYKENEIMSTIYIWRILSGIGLIIWWIYELVVISNGIRHDGNDAPLENW
jgi:hypothetical protein